MIRTPRRPPALALDQAPASTPTRQRTESPTLQGDATLQRTVGNAALARRHAQPQGDTPARPVAQRSLDAIIQRMLPAGKRKGPPAGSSPTPPKRPRIVLPRFLDGNPTYGAHNNRDGGTSMTVVLGPAADFATNAGSIPGRDQCTAVNLLRKNAAKMHMDWKKGHLLNQTLGGPGVSVNLTPLSGVGNAQHSGVETTLKNAVTSVRLHADNHPNDDYWFGVRYTVTKVGKKWAAAKQAYIQNVGHHLEVEAEYQRLRKAGDAVEDLDGSENTNFTPLPADIPNIPIA